MVAVGGPGHGLRRGDRARLCAVRARGARADWRCTANGGRGWRLDAELDVDSSHPAGNMEG